MQRFISNRSSDITKVLVIVILISYSYYLNGIKTNFSNKLKEQSELIKERENYFNQITFKLNTREKEDNEVNSKINKLMDNYQKILEGLRKQSDMANDMITQLSNKLENQKREYLNEQENQEKTIKELKAQIIRHNKYIQIGKLDRKSNRENMMNKIVNFNLKEHKEKILDIKYNPQNANEMASCGKDKFIVIWNVLTGQPKGILNGHAGEINHISYNPHDTNELASAGKDGLVIVWDIENRKVKHKLDHDEFVASIDFNPHNSKELATFIDSKIFFWNLNDLTKREIYLGGGAVSISYDPHNENRFVAATTDTISIWDPIRLEKLHQFNPELGPIGTCLFNPVIESELAVGGFTGQVSIYEMERTTIKFKINNSSHLVNSISFDNYNGNYIAISNSVTVSVWDTTIKKMIKYFDASPLTVTSLAINPNYHNELSVASSDNVIRFWKIK